MPSSTGSLPNLTLIPDLIRDKDYDNANDKTTRLLMMRMFYRTPEDQILQKFKQTLTPEDNFYCHLSYSERLVEIIAFHQINIQESSTKIELFGRQRVIIK